MRRDPQKSVLGKALDRGSEPQVDGAKHASPRHDPYTFVPSPKIASTVAAWRLLPLILQFREGCYQQNFSKSRLSSGIIFNSDLNVDIPYAD